MIESYTNTTFYITLALRWIRYALHLPLAVDSQRAAENPSLWAINHWRFQDFWTNFGHHFLVVVVVVVFWFVYRIPMTCILYPSGADMPSTYKHTPPRQPLLWTPHARKLYTEPTRPTPAVKIREIVLTFLIIPRNFKNFSMIFCEFCKKFWNFREIF